MTKIYPKGNTIIGPLKVAAGSRARIGLLRDNWPASGGEEIASLDTYFSLDGGRSWALLIQFGAPGGQAKNGAGQHVDFSHVNTPIPAPCVIRGVLTLKRPLSTAVKVAVH